MQEQARKSHALRQIKRRSEEMRIIKNALRIKELESKDQVYVAHRAKVLDKAGK